MVFGLFRSKVDDRPRRIYAAAVAAARRPVFYESFGVPDSVEGRMEMVMLHTGLAVSRLSAADGDRDLARAVSEAFFSDMEASLREIGTSDLGVPKKMKKIASAFYGRLKAYEEAEDEAALAEALKRNVAGEGPADARPLAAYVRTLAATLRETDMNDLAAGRIAWPDPDAFLPRRDQP